jgi:hypothetical protein
VRVCASVSAHVSVSVSVGVSACSFPKVKSRPVRRVIEGPKSHFACNSTHGTFTLSVVNDQRARERGVLPAGAAKWSTKHAAKRST